MCTQIWAVNVLYSAQGNLPIWWGNIPTHRKLGSSLGKRIPPCFWKGMWKWSAIWKHIRGPFESQRIFWIARFLQVIYNFSLLPCQKVKKKMHFLDIPSLLCCYSLVKMICAIASKSHRSPNEQELATAIKRNFGGLEGLDPVQDFGEFLPTLLETRVYSIYGLIYIAKPLSLFNAGV